MCTVIIIIIITISILMWPNNIDYRKVHNKAKRKSED